MTFPDIIITLIPALATLVLTTGLLRAARTMAPPAWPYWMSLVFAVCCLTLPWRYGSNLPWPMLVNALETPRAFTLDLLLEGTIYAVASGLALSAWRLRGHRRATISLLVLTVALIACAILIGFQMWMIATLQSDPL